MLDRLRHFVHICDQGSFTAAAAEAGLTQPALTASIRRLERDLGGPVLDRLPGGARPNAAGRALLPWARRALAAEAQGRRAVADVLGLRSGEVRIGAGATACTYLLPDVLLRFRRAHPGVRIHLRESGTEEVRDAVATGALDLGIVTGEGEPWRIDRLVLVAGPELVTDMPPSGAPHLSFPRGSPIRALLEAHFPEAEVVMELNSITAIKGHVRAGMGVALVSEAAVAHDLQTGRLVRLDDPRTPLVRTLSLVHEGPRALSPAAAALRELLVGEAAAPRPLSPRGSG